jgi:hypothetical protein
MNIIDDLKVQYKIGGIVTGYECGFVCDSVVVFSLLSLLGINIDYLNYVSLSSNGALLWKPCRCFCILFSYRHHAYRFNMIVLNFQADCL